MTLTDDDLDRLLTTVGDELDRLSNEWRPIVDAQPARRRGRALAAAVAAGLAAAAAAGLLVVRRDDERAPAAPIATVATATVDPQPPPELPVIEPDRLPFEVLAATPPGFEVTQYFSDNMTQFPGVYDGHALLLGWGNGDVLVPVIVWPLDAIDDAGPDARRADLGTVTGWIDDAARIAQFDLGAGRAIKLDVLGAVPDDELIALAAALDPRSPDLAWATMPPAGFTQIGRQRPAVWQRSVTYADFDADSSMNYAAYSSFPVFMFANLGQGSSIVAVDGYAGAWTITDAAGMTGGFTFWVGDDGVVRSYIALSHEGRVSAEITAAELESVVARVRPATAAERAQYGTGAG